MKKRFLSLLLALSLSLAIPSFAAGAAGPTPPTWCPAEEYAVFANSQAYKGDTWSKILSLREDAAAGNLAPTSSSSTVLYNRQRALKKSNDPGVRFELGLIDVKYALNAAAQGKAVGISSDFEMAAYYGKGDEPACYLAYLWNARSKLWTHDLTTGLEGALGYYAASVAYLFPYESFTMDQILNWGQANGVSAERLAYAKSLLFVTLDGDLVHPRSVRISADAVDTTTAQTRNQRTMVPIRRLAELMGATVDYDASSRQITIRRAADTFVMTLDRTEALRNGEPFQMDVAPYAENNRTYIPIRYIAECFGQSVEWNGGQQHVVIQEDKSVAGDSNLEAWALAMGALLNYENNPQEAHLFGGKRRFGANPVGGVVSNRLETTGPDFGRRILADSWGITDREALIAAVGTLVQSLDQTYPAWDLFRVSHLAQWGYLAGYVTYYEALELVEPAAQALCDQFSAWEAAYENYLEGWCAWSGQDAADVWQTSRGLLYREMRTTPDMARLLDDNLFQAGVVPLPG